MGSCLLSPQSREFEVYTKIRYTKSTKSIPVGGVAAPPIHILTSILEYHYFTWRKQRGYLTIHLLLKVSVHSFKRSTKKSEGIFLNTAEYGLNITAIIYDQVLSNVSLSHRGSSLEICV